MAYPSGTDWRAVSAVVGSQPIQAAETTQRHNLGMRTRAHDHTYGPGEFIYLAGVASTAAGDLVQYDSKTGATIRAVEGSRGPLAVAMSACVAGCYGWYAVAGSVPVASESLHLGPGFLGSTTSTVVLPGRDSERIDGLSVRSAASGGFSACQLHLPSANGGYVNSDEEKGLS